MPDCKHESLEYAGEQKTEEGVNSYYKCRACGMMLVMTPSRKVYGVPGVQPRTLPSGGKKRTS